MNKLKKKKKKPDKHQTRLYKVIHLATCFDSMGVIIRLVSKHIKGI